MADSSSTMALFDCVFCDNYYHNYDEYIIHLYRKHQPRYYLYCPNCMKHFPTRTALKAHFESSCREAEPIIIIDDWKFGHPPTYTSLYLPRSHCGHPPPLHSGYPGSIPGCATCVFESCLVCELYFSCKVVSASPYTFLRLDLIDTVFTSYKVSE